MNRGDPALVRHVFRGRIASVLPMTVVEETDERTLLYLAAGTPIRWIDGSPMPDWIERGCGTIASQWTDTNCLHIVPAGRAHSTFPMWFAETGEFLCWYVNLQEPFRRTRLGWDTCDQELDIVVAADRSWDWKDEKEFEERVTLGLLTRAEADAVRREGEAVIADIEAQRPPFCEPWPDWRPDPAWPIPTLPDEWHVLET